MNLSSLAASAGKIDSCVIYSKMADEQPPAPVVVLPADVPEPPPPPAVAAAVAKENPPDAAAVTPHAEVNFPPLICGLFVSAISHVSLVFPRPFSGSFSVRDEFCDSPAVLLLHYRLGPLSFT